MGGSSGYVLLRGGLAVPVTPVLQLLNLEARGFSVSQDGDDIVIAPFLGLIRFGGRFSYAV